MTGLLILFILLAALVLGLGIHFYLLTISTMQEHRRAMNAMHQKIAREHLAEQQANTAARGTGHGR
jgi:hypothetical protein